MNTSTSVDAIFLDREKLPADLDTEQDYFDVVRDNESLKLRNRRLTSEMEKLNTTNKTLVYKTYSFFAQPDRILLVSNLTCKLASAIF